MSLFLLRLSSSSSLGFQLRMWTATWRSEFRISSIVSHCARPILWCQNCTSGSSCWLVVRCIAHIRITGRQWWWATNPFTLKAEYHWCWKSFTMPLWPDSFNSTDRGWAGRRTAAQQKSWLWNGMGKNHLQCVEMELIPWNWVCVSYLSSRLARVWKRTKKDWRVHEWSVFYLTH